MMKTELLSPAGTLKSMHYAFAYGADAVYAGQPRYSLRVRNNDFLEDNLRTGIAQAHALGKRFFLTVNLMPHNAKLKTFLRDLQPIVDMGPDALIMADPGLIAMAREAWPDMPIHLSVQANTVNWAAVRFWRSVGVERVILSRELSLDEVAEIRQQCPDTELEVFVHGALCIAYSGRCLLSGYFNHRDPNQGTCTNACRWEYKTLPAQADAAGVYRPAGAGPGQEVTIPLAAFPGGAGRGLDEAGVSTLASTLGEGPRHPLADQVYFLEEASRPGELMEVSEDEHGTYIMNSRDLRAVEHVQRLVEIGVDCLKIEGRTKSHYYVARTAQVYRRAIDDAQAGRAFDPRLLGELENLASRGYTDGFYQRHHTQDYQNYLEGASRGEVQQFVGEVLGVDAQSGLAEVDVKNKMRVGDRLELILPGGNREIVLESMFDRQGAPMDEAPGGGYRVQLPWPAGVDPAYGLIARHLPG